MSDQVVIHAQLVDRDGFVFQRSVEVSQARDQHGFQKVQTRSRAFRLPPEQFRPRQDPSTLNFEHDHTTYAGRLVALERDTSGIWGTWTSHDLKLLLEREPVFVSAEVRWRGGDADAEDIRLEGTALCRRTAAVFTKPALILAGRLDRREDRHRWKLPSAVAARLERAAETARHHRTGTPIQVHGLQTPDQEYAMFRARALEQHYRSHPWEIPRQKPGEIERSQHPGRILSVR